jgi:hypothetical protein
MYFIVSRVNGGFGTTFSGSMCVACMALQQYPIRIFLEPFDQFGLERLPALTPRQAIRPWL